MTRTFTQTETTALALFGLAVLIMAALFFIGSNDLISATLILIAFACFISALFIFTFRKKEQVDADIAALLAVPSMTTTSRLLSDLGVSGPARFIPVTDDGTFPSLVMQFNPVSEFKQVRLTGDTSFYTGPDGEGVLTVPSGAPLLSFLTGEKSLTIPETEPDIFAAVKEAGEDLLELAEAVTVTRNGDEIVIELGTYLLISGCRAAREESPRICALAPCPVCSLMAMMLAQGFGNPVTVEQVSVDREAGNLTIRIRQNWIEDVLKSPAVEKAAKGGGFEVSRLR